MSDDPLKLTKHELRTRVFDYAINGPLDKTQEEIVAQKSEALRAVYYADEIHMLVFNGGLHYYFDSHGLRTVLDTERALLFIHAPDHLRLFRSAVCLLQGDIPLNAWKEEHLSKRWSSDLESISYKFSMTEPELGDVVSNFISDNLSLFSDVFKNENGT